MENWENYLLKSFNSMVSDNNTTEIGKLISPASELIVSDKLNSLGIQNKQIQKRPFDLITDSGIRIQVKFRIKDFHFETTRRNSKKNIKNNKTGHISYRTNEFDFVIFIKPTNFNFTLINCDFTVIPTFELTNVSRELTKNYKNNTKMTLKFSKILKIID